MLTAADMARILNLNFGFPLERDEKFGLVVNMSPYDAYVFSLVTGAQYLVNKYGFSPFKTMEVFSQRASLCQGCYQFIPGLFYIDNEKREVILVNSPLLHSVKYPTLFSNDKTLLIVEVIKTSNIEPKIFNIIKERGDNPDDYLCLKVKSKSQIEHFLEYIASLHFNRLGYFTDNQIPWSYYGIPDFGAYKTPKLKPLLKRNLVEGGIYIKALSLISIFNKVGKMPTNFLGDKYKFIVGEAKSIPQSTQIGRYLSSGLCNEGYEIMPSGTSIKSRYSILTFDKSLRLIEIRKKIDIRLNDVLRKIDEIWLIDYIKFYLLANFSSDDLNAFIFKKTGEKISTSSEFIKFVKALKISEILDEIKKTRKNLFFR